MEPSPRSSRSVVLPQDGQARLCRVRCGVFTEADALRSEGTISLGAYNFNSTDQKMGLYAQVFHEPLVGGSVAVEMLNDINSPTSSRWAGTPPRGPCPSATSPTPDRSTRPRSRFALRAQPPTRPRPACEPRRVPRHRHPRSRDRVAYPPAARRGDRGRWGDPGRNVPADYDSLVNLVQSRRRFTYREGVRTYELHAVDFVWQPHKQTQDSKTFTGTFVLVAQELT